MITLVHKGNFKATETFLRKCRESKFLDKLDAVAKKGVDALAAATPVDTGKTAASWGYEVTIAPGSATLTWTNSNTNQGVPIALLIQYGHGTPTGGYVPGKDYIKPAIRPIMDELTNALWKEVSEL